MALATIDNWEYSRWVEVIGRSLRYNPATGAERTAAQTFVNAVLVKRPWLDVMYDANTNNDGTQPDDVQALGRIIFNIGRDMQQNISIQDVTEKGYIDTLIAATGNRRYGDQANTIAADVQQP